MSGPDINLHYEVHQGNGPHILMLHGVLSSREQWSLNVPALQKVSRPVLVELLAHGRSAAPEEPEHYHPDAYVRAFEAIREKLGVERWFICGQSFGAGLTLRYALCHPERVLAQVFTNSYSALADQETMAMYRNNSEKRARAVEQGGHAAIAELPIHPGKARRLPVQVRDALIRDAGLLRPKGLARTFRYSAPHLSVRREVRDTSVPTLLICGAYETRFKSNHEYALANIPNLQVIEAAVGHAVNIEAADVFNSAVTAWIGQHGGARA